MQAYARISNPCQRDWALASAALLRCQASFSAASPAYLRGWLGTLALNRRRIACLQLQTRVSLQCAAPGFLSLLVCRSGTLQVNTGQTPPVTLHPGQINWLHHGQDVSLTSAEPLDLLWVQWDDTVPEHAMGLSASALAADVEAYLLSVRFAADHGEAIARSEQFLTYLESGGSPPGHWVPGSTDRRLARVLALIERQSHGDFDLVRLARDAAMSERSLFYLMKSTLGMSPYRCYQRLRLIRARHGLVDCLAEHAGVSWHAANQGFSHLGRFASVYRTHFGELPSETLAWLTRLRESAHLLSWQRGSGEALAVSKNPGLFDVVPTQCE